MRIASFEIEGWRLAGALDGDRLYPIAGEGPLGPATDFAALARARPEAEGYDLAEVRLLAPVPVPGKIICLGLNYRGHVEETLRDEPTYPVLFTKFSDAVVGPYDPVAKPPESDQVDYEGELALVIGRPTRRVPPERALESVAGFTVANDVTMRDFQHKSHQWLQGKAWAGSTPLGPHLVSGDELDDASRLAISLSLNGERMQSASTELMIFGVAETVSAISTFTELLPGDVILMGTPAGVGFKRDPQVFLRPGDRVRVEIDGIGAIENEIVAERPRADEGG